MSGLIAPSRSTLCFIDEFEALLAKRINHHIRLARDANTVPLKVDLPRLCPLHCKMISIRDLDVPRVQIDRRIVLIIVLARLTVVVILLRCSQ